MNDLNKQRLAEASEVLGAVLEQHSNRDADLNRGVAKADLLWGLELAETALDGLDAEELPELREAMSLLRAEMDWGLDLNDGVGYSDLEWTVRTLDAAVDAVTVLA
jgi:hypothetical protein